MTDTIGLDRTTHDIHGIKTVVLIVGGSPELVFLHGASTFAGFDVTRSWALRRKVIIPYYPNFGHLGNATALDTIEVYVLHYMDLFDRLGLTTFDLAGFSLGGWIAAEFAQRLRRLVLIAPTELVVESSPAPDFFEIAPQELPSYLGNDVNAALGDFPEGPDPVFEAQLGREVGALAHLVHDNSQGNPKLACWPVPAQLLWSTADRMRPTAQADTWMRLLPNGYLSLVPNTRHLVFEETRDTGNFVADLLGDESRKEDSTGIWL